MKILKILIGVPVFFILELLARIFIPVLAKFKKPEQKALMTELANLALQLNVLHFKEDFAYRSMLNRLAGMSVNFKHLVETAFILADPETIYDDVTDDRRPVAKRFVNLLLKYRETLNTKVAYTVTVDDALETRRTECLKDDFGYKWYNNMIDLGMVDQYLFYVSTKQCGVWLSPLKSGGK